MSLSLFMKLVRLLMKERMEYRADFMLGALAQIINYGASYLVIWLFLKKFESIAGWNWSEIALLYSIGLFTYAVGASFSFVQMRDLEGQVKSGDFDGILVKPVNPYFYLICRGFNIGYIAHIIISTSVLLWVFGQLEVDWSWVKVVYFVIALLSGSMIQAGIMSIIGGCAFIWVQTGFMFSLFFRLKEFISYPISVYSVLIQILLIFFVPLAFINFYPSAFILSKESPFVSEWGAWFAPLVGPLVFWLGYRFWMFCANKYQGAGG